MSSRIFVIGALLFTCLGAGCGQELGTITGTVTFQDKPLSSGSVVVVGADGMPRTAPIVSDGSYTFLDVPCGETKLAVHCPDPALQDEVFAEEKVKFQKGLTKSFERKQSDVDRAKWFAIPADYGDFNKSGLVYQVKKGSNTFNIKLN